MGVVLNGLFALVAGSFISYGALGALAAVPGEVRWAWALRRRGRTATATIVSLAALDMECSTQQAVVRFEVEPGREVERTAHLRWKVQPELVKRAQVQIRYDPATPETTVASEAGRRQGLAEIRMAVLLSALMLVGVLPTSAYLVYAGLNMLLS